MTNILVTVMTTALRQQISHLQRNRAPAAGGRAPARQAKSRHVVSALDAQVAATGHGQLLVWEKPLSEVWSYGEVVARNLWQALDGAWSLPQAPAGLEPLVEADLEGIGWLDIESAGFMGRPIFLIGVMRPRGDDLVITQFLAADYSQERALLAHCAEATEDLQVLVTFNGKCFDLPFLRDRMTYHRVSRRLEVELVDLLWPARRRWRGVLPDCRLQTLERHLCRRARPGDIPSALIPERYHEFVRTQDASLIAPIMRHNRLDLLTMAELAALLLAGEAAPAPENQRGGSHAVKAG